MKKEEKKLIKMLLDTVTAIMEGILVVEEYNYEDKKNTKQTYSARLKDKELSTMKMEIITTKIKECSPQLAGAQLSRQNALMYKRKNKTK